MNLSDCKISIWFKCLVCHRCFQYKSSFIVHRTTSPCRHEYRSILQQRSKRSLSSSIYSGNESDSRDAESNDVQISDENPNLQDREETSSLGQNVRSSPEVQISDRNDQDMILQIPPKLLDPMQEIVQPDSPGVNNNNFGEIAPISSQTEEERLKLRKNYTRVLGFKCYFCSKGTSNLRTLKRHLLIHTMEKCFECLICKQEFQRNDYLKRHQSTTHGNTIQSSVRKPTKIKPKNNSSKLKMHLPKSKIPNPRGQIPCLVCPKKFVTRYGLTRHNRAVHKLQRHACAFCEKSYTQEHNLKLHRILVHKNRKAHACSLCVKSFAKPFLLKNHVLVAHEGQKPYSCRLCDKAYAWGRSLRSHILSAHVGNGNSS